MADELTERHYMIVSDLRSVRIAKQVIHGVITEEVQDDYKTALRHLDRMEQRLAKLVKDASS